MHVCVSVCIWDTNVHSTHTHTHKRISTCAKVHRTCVWTRENNQDPVCLVAWWEIFLPRQQPCKIQDRTFRTIPSPYKSKPGPSNECVSFRFVCIEPLLKCLLKVYTPGPGVFRRTRIRLDQQCFNPVNHLFLCVHLVHRVCVGRCSFPVQIFARSSWFSERFWQFN